MDDKYQLRYLVMPDYIYTDKRLNDTSRRVYCFIHTFKGESFYFSNKHMAEMFKCSEWSVSKAISKLEELGYISTVYKIKSDGGKIRFIKDNESRLWENHKSDFGKTTSRTLGKPQGNDNKINGNKLKVRDRKGKYSSIKSIKEEDIVDIAQKYRVSVGFVQYQFEALKNYVSSKGRRYKDYKAALRNFVLRGMKEQVEKKSNEKYRAVDARHIR